MRDGKLNDRSFVSMVVTQFLGAFNDNAFKQLVLLLAVDINSRKGVEAGGYDTLAAGLFALPFVLFSGFAGNVADRFSKTNVIRLAKFGEILVMVLGGVAFWFESMPVLLATVFLTGTQSAFFGPAKYGILPEMLPEKHLSRANGIILMTTFLSIILGMAAAGILRDLFGEQLYKPQIVYIALAILGTWTAFGVRKLPPAQPELAVAKKPVGDLFPTIREMFRDRDFKCVVLANSYYWFLGAAVQLVINRYGRTLMELDNFFTSLMLVWLSAGMALGALGAGLLSKDRVRIGLTDLGMLAMISALVALTWAHASFVVACVVFFVLGLGGGAYGVPLQTLVQLWPPETEKGRVVAAVNFLNWVLILTSAGYFAIATSVFETPYIPTSLAVLSFFVTLLLRRRLRAAVPAKGSED